jgi:hypothetical protein
MLGRGDMGYLEDKFSHVNKYMKNDLKTKLDKKKLSKISRRFNSELEFAYWNIMLNLIEEWT